MTEREKMLGGHLYDASDPQLSEARLRCRAVLQTYNGTLDPPARRRLLGELLGSVGEEPWIEPPFYCDYGAHIHFGSRVYLNFNCVFLDPAEIRVGDDVLFGPAAQVYTATHPLSVKERRTRKESALPVRIGSDVWVGGGAIVLPGVTIGDGSVIGAGAVVTKDVPSGVFAAGNPCRVLSDL